MDQNQLSTASKELLTQGASMQLSDEQMRKLARLALAVSQTQELETLCNEVLPIVAECIGCLACVVASTLSLPGGERNAQQLCSQVLLYEASTQSKIPATGTVPFVDSICAECPSLMKPVFIDTLGREQSAQKPTTDWILANPRSASAFAFPFVLAGHQQAVWFFSFGREQECTPALAYLLEAVASVCTAGYQRIVLRNQIEQRPILKANIETELLSNTDFFQAIVDNTSAVIYVKAVDGRYLLINKEFESLFGVHQDSFVGKTDYDYFEPDFAAEFQENDKRALETGEKVRCEELVPGEDGVRTYISVKFPLYDANSVPVAVAGISTDITHLKSIERELRETNLFLDSIIEHIPDMIFVKEAKELRFVRLNKSAERLLGFSREELLGSNDYDFFPKEQADQFTKKDRQVLDAASIEDIAEEPIDTKYFGKRFLHTKKISILDEDGIPKFLLGISEDVTEKKRARELLQEAHQQLERKVAERTEELQNLNEELKSLVSEREEANKYIQAALREKEILLKEIHHRVKNNMQVISSLLKLQSRHIADDRARQLFLQSDQRVRSMALIHESLYRSEGLADIELSQYITDLANNLFRSYAVDSRRVQLRTNLVSVRLGLDQAIPCGLLLNEFFSNSLKHAFPDEVSGEIAVYLEKEGQSVTLTYTDSGIGLPANFSIEEQKSLGFEIIRTLSAQLDASLKILERNPTTFALQFDVVSNTRLEDYHGRSKHSDM